MSKSADSIWAVALDQGEPPDARVTHVLDTVPGHAREVLLLANAAAGSEMRARIDAVVVESGFRRHPLLFECVTFSEIEGESGYLLLPYERVGASVLKAYPSNLLAIESERHADHSRAAGRASDLHLARYRFASEQIPADAHVLDAGCGLGYGAALLWRESPKRSVTGIDLSGWAIDYADASFHHEPGPQYRRGDACDLGTFADGGLDAIVALDTIDQLIDPVWFLRHVRRALRPDGIFVASVPFRRDTEADTTQSPSGWFDASRLLGLCGRALIVENLWSVTATTASVQGANGVRAWRRCAVLGEEPEGPVDSLILVARKQQLLSGTRRSWLFLAPGVPQLATMAAASPGWGCRPEEVSVLGTSPISDEHLHEAMRASAEAFGFAYAGNILLAPDADTIGDALVFAPDDVTGRGSCGERVRSAYPVLEELRDLNVALPARPSMPGDYALLAGLQPREVRLVVDGIQNDLIIRDFGLARGFETNPLSQFPTPSGIACPPWLATETAVIGRAEVLDVQSCADALALVRDTSPARALTMEIERRQVPFTAVVVSQHFSRGALTSDEAEWVFYLHQIRTLLQRTTGAVLFKAHPRDRYRKIEALVHALRDEGERVRITVGAECHLPLEAFPHLAARADSLHVWGTSSSALLGVRPWPGARPRCIDADYLEPEIRRQALQFSRRHGLPLETLCFDGPTLDAAERTLLRRPFKSVIAASLERMARRSRRAEDAQRRATAEAERMARENILLEHLLRARGGEIWIWGTGALGRLLLQRFRALAIEPAGFIDGSDTPRQRAIEGISVRSANEARRVCAGDALVVIASAYADEIQCRIIADGDWTATIIAWTAQEGSSRPSADGPVVSHGG